MTDSGTGSSSKLLRESLSFAGPSAADPHTPQGTLGSRSVMLSVDFSTPLAGAARTERIKQMTQNHLAFEKSRRTQDILVKAQHALRRMPGVSGQEANGLVSQLQEAGQMINQETMQLVDALMNVTLDQEETDKAIARMSIDANLAQARTDDQAQTISDLRVEVKAEREKRERCEAEAKQVLERLQAVSEELKRVKEMVREREETTSADDLVKSLAENLRQMDRRMLSAAPAWLQEQRRARAANARQEDRQQGSWPEAAKTPVAAGSGGGGCGDDCLVARGGGSREEASRSAPTGPARVSPVFTARTPTAVPPKFGPLQAGPPRAPAAMSHERRFQGGWAGQGRGGGGGGGFTGSSAFSNPPRKGNFQPLPRYRPNGGADHQHWAGFGASQECAGRPASSYGHGREYYPSTPTSGGRNRYGRFADAAAGTLDFGGGPRSASSSAVISRGGVAGPPIHLTERAMAAWNEQVMDLYGAIRHFVARHASEPDHDMVQVGHSSLWPVMLAMHHPLSDSEAASYLGFHLRNENSKACVVTRVVVDYVVNRVWVPGAWIGSDSRTSYDLMDLQRDLEATHGQASAARQPLLNQQASIIGYILRNEHGTAWHRHKVADVARALQATVRPLLNRFASQAEARRDLELVAELAWELSSKMLSSRLTFDFRFPDIGARFSAQSMLPIWPHMDPADLQAKHWRVAFVTTPAITCRNDTGGSISAHSVSLADVLCMQ